MFLITLCLFSLVEFSTVGNGNGTCYDYRACLVRDSSPSLALILLVTSCCHGGPSRGHRYAACSWGRFVALAGCSVGFSSQPWLCWFILRQLPQDGSVAIIWLNLPHLIACGNASPGSILAAVHPTKEDPCLSLSCFPYKSSSVAFYWHCHMGWISDVVYSLNPAEGWTLRLSSGSMGQWTGDLIIFLIEFQSKQSS